MEKNSSNIVSLRNPSKTSLNYQLAVVNPQPPKPLPTLSKPKPKILEEDVYF